MSIETAGEYVPAWTDGDKLRKVRRHLRLNQEQMAELLQVKASTYMAWESDRNRIKDLKAIARRCKALAGTPLWWWFDTEPPRPSDPDGGLTEPPGGIEPPTYSLRGKVHALKPTPIHPYRGDGHPTRPVTTPSRIAS